MIPRVRCSLLFGWLVTNYYITIWLPFRQRYKKQFRPFSRSDGIFRDGSQRFEPERLVVRKPKRLNHRTKLLANVYQTAVGPEVSMFVRFTISIYVIYRKRHNSDYHCKDITYIYIQSDSQSIFTISFSFVQKCIIILIFRILKYT